MPDLKPIGDLDMLHWIPKGMSVSNWFPMGHVGFRWVSKGECQLPLGHVGQLDGSSIRHVGLRCSMSRSLMDLRSGMSVSNEAFRGLRWVSDQATCSPMKHIEVSDGSPIRHVGLR